MRSILVATDFSARSDRALRRAVLLAGSLEAAILLVHIVDDDQPAHLVNRRIGDAQELLDRMAETLRAVDGVAVSVVVTTGEPFAGIVDQAAAAAADLIVIGPHRRQFLDTVVGTTAERTIRRSRVPVLMANAVPAGRYRRTMIAVDFDDASAHAIRAASSSAVIAGTDISVFHTYDTPAVGMMQRSLQEPRSITRYVADEEERVAERLSAFLAENGLTNVRSTLVAQHGPAAAAICSNAERERADLIVMGTHQRSGLKRLFLGSVAQEVLFDVKPDVLVIPAEMRD